MNIGELIKELQKYDPKTNVEIDIGEIPNQPIKCVEPTIFNSGTTTDGIVIIPKRVLATYLKKM